MTNEEKPREFIIYEQHGELKACEGPKLFIEYSGAKPTKVINTTAKSEYDAVVAERDELWRMNEQQRKYYDESVALLTLVTELEVALKQIQRISTERITCEAAESAEARINEFRKGVK